MLTFGHRLRVLSTQTDCTIISLLSSQVTLPTTREHWIHWDMMYRLDPTRFVYHKMDPLSASRGYLYLVNRFVQQKCALNVNGISTADTGYSYLPSYDGNAANGDAFNNQTFSPDSWATGNITYNSTQFTLFMAGDSSQTLEVNVDLCSTDNPSGINASVPIDPKAVLLWSQSSTWSFRNGGVPGEGDNVTIPAGLNLVIDVDTPKLYALVIFGNVTFSRTANVILTVRPMSH